MPCSSAKTRYIEVIFWINCCSSVTQVDSAHAFRSLVPTFFNTQVFLQWFLFDFLCSFSNDVKFRDKNRNSLKHVKRKTHRLWRTKRDKYIIYLKIYVSGCSSCLYIFQMNASINPPLIRFCSKTKEMYLKQHKSVAFLRIVPS